MLTAGVSDSDDLRRTAGLRCAGMAADYRKSRRSLMIARIWRGVVRAQQADEYYRYLEETGLKEYRQTPGNRGVQVLRRIQGETCEYLLITFWESWEAIRRFAGVQPEKAVYYPRDLDFLPELEPNVQHFGVLTTYTSEGAASSAA